MPQENTNESTPESGLSSHALFSVPIWNPLEHGIRNTPLMVPAHEYNRVASNLADALSLALQYVPLTGDDADKIRKLERAATIPPNAEVEARREKASESTTD